MDGAHIDDGWKKIQKKHKKYTKKVIIDFYNGEKIILNYIKKKLSVH